MYVALFFRTLLLLLDQTTGQFELKDGLSSDVWSVVYAAAKLFDYLLADV